MHIPIDFINSRLIVQVNYYGYMAEKTVKFHS